VGGKSIGVLLIHGVALLLALPEPALGRAGCVAVIGRGAEGALLLAVADETILNEDRDEEEDTTWLLAFLSSASREGYLRSNNSNCKAGRFQSASRVKTWQSCETSVSLRNSVVDIGVSTSERSVDKASAAAVTTTGSICYIDKCSSEGEIKQHAQQREECDATKAAY